MVEMHAIETVVGRMRRNGPAPALFWHGREFSYSAFFEMMDAWTARLGDDGIGPGAVCGVLGDYSPRICALLLALIRQRAILVPFTRVIEKEIPALREIAGVQHMFRFESSDAWTLESRPEAAQSELICVFRERQTPGLVMFTSGSTGRPKGILHDCERVIRKFVKERGGWRTVLFLMMDHFGGFNTLLSTFAYGGVAVCLQQRTPEAVCRAITESRATLLPTTPTFLNLLVFSGSYREYDLSSIRLITYGTEVMSDTTLQAVRAIFPNAELKQTYGLSELGVLRSKSESGDSVWVKVGGEGFEVKVVDGLLWVRSESNMVGYLNAPSPFDGEGWMCTGDRVEVRGEYIRILGRESEVVNVGGQKVFPIEVETALLQAPNIRDATVYGVKHPLTGQVVRAHVSLHEPEDPIRLSERLRKFCLERMADYKVPVKYTIVSEEEQRSERFKKIRNVEGG
jgi:acyl-CoA synthetase (AMP-forming)/AMP-acid ligase II